MTQAWYSCKVTHCPAYAVITEVMRFRVVHRKKSWPQDALWTYVDDFGQRWYTTYDSCPWPSLSSVEKRTLRRIQQPNKATQGVGLG